VPKPPSVTREEALAEACPVCQAEPGASCVYEYDVFAYKPGPAGRVKTLVHERGQAMATGVHNARAGIAKVRIRAEYGSRSRWQGAYQGGPRGLKNGLISDEEMDRLYRACVPIGEIAEKADLSERSVRARLKKFGWWAQQATRGEDYG
jgi:hypothetical protein